MQIHENPELSALWQELSAQADLPCEGWVARLISRREDARRSRCVWRLRRGAESLALKHVIHPNDPAAFGAEVAAHLEVQERFDAVPALLAADLARQGALMRWAGTQTLFDALAQADASGRPDLLEQAGAWVARFHASASTDRRIFQPKYSIRHLRQMMEEVARGARKVARQEAWLAAAEALCAQQNRFEGQQTVGALGHGDLNLRNILMGPPLRGIDFRKSALLPVGHDIARLLVHYAALLGDPAPDGLLPRAETEGFFRGYDLVGPEDPSVGFLCRMRVLVDWQMLPPDEARFTLPERRRLEGLLRLAGTLLA